MATYSDTAAALADGIHIVHEPEASRFAVYQHQDDAKSLVGEAHYTLRRQGKVDFDHTLIVPRLRGTGLSDLLAQHALTSDVAKSNEITASCWFIAEYLAKHPELAH